MKRISVMMAGLSVASALLFAGCQPKKEEGSFSEQSTTETTAPDTTEKAPGTTEKTPDTTTEETTTAPEQPDNTTPEQPDNTTGPEEDETTSAPVVTDPEATTEVEVTDPEVIGGDDTGCGSIVSAGIAIIAILGTAIIMKKRD